ncbi:MAG: hypothetical protein HUK28_03375 [Methanobrevibacter sp.]|nr:hypothetical protein [Methanobrevibacter sp.]
MDAAEVIAIVILIIAVIVLIYYFIQINPKAINSVRNNFPTNSDRNINNFFRGQRNDSEEYDISDDVGEKEGMGKKIKVKLSDIDMSSFNTDAFSKKIDAFLDHKSDQLIEEWSLATKDDLSELEARFDKTTSRIDALDDDFKKFKKSSETFQKTTKTKLDEIDKRIDELEKK